VLLCFDPATLCKVPSLNVFLFIALAVQLASSPTALSPPVYKQQQVAGRDLGLDLSLTRNTSHLVLCVRLQRKALPKRKLTFASS